MGKNPENDLASCLALPYGFGVISADADGQAEHLATTESSATEPTSYAQKAGFTPGNTEKTERRRRDSNPRNLAVQRFSRPSP